MSILAALAVLASCERKPEFSEVTELGCAQKEAVVDAAGGEAIFSIIASGEVCAEVTEGSEWASLSESRWTGDADLCIAFGENSGRERKAFRTAISLSWLCLMICRLWDTTTVLSIP